MRLDAYLKKSQLIKRRTIAREMIENGLVLVEDKKVKPSYQVKANDIITIYFGSKMCRFQVVDCSHKCSYDVLN